MLTYFGLAGIFLLLLLNAAEVSERSVVTPEEFEIAFPKVMGWIQKTLLAHQRLALPVTSKNFQRLPLYFSPAQICPDSAGPFIVSILLALLFSLFLVSARRQGQF